MSDRVAKFKEEVRRINNNALAVGAHTHEVMDPPWDNFQWIVFRDQSGESVVRFEICKHCTALFAVAHDEPDNG
jgi:hypothetical protein